MATTKTETETNATTEQIGEASSRRSATSGDYDCNTSDDTRCDTSSSPPPEPETRFVDILALEELVLPRRRRAEDSSENALPLETALAYAEARATGRPAIVLRWDAQRHPDAATIEPNDARVFAVLAKNLRERLETETARAKYRVSVEGRNDSPETLILRRRLQDLGRLLQGANVSTGARVEHATAIASEVVEMFSGLDTASSPERLYAAVKQIDDLLGYPTDENLLVAYTLTHLALGTPTAQVFLEQVVTRAATLILLRLASTTELLDRVCEKFTEKDERLRVLQNVRRELEVVRYEANRLTVNNLVQRIRERELTTLDEVVDENVDDLVSPVFQGVRSGRLRDHAAERAVAQLWEAQNTLASSLAFEEGANLASWWPDRTLLARLLSRGEAGITPSPRDWLVASTVIQWLGTESGMAFIRQLLYATATKPHLPTDEETDRG